MKIALTTLLFTLLLTGTAAAQNDITVKIRVDPVFPPEASIYLYGDKIRIAVEVDKTGKVTKAVSIGPMIPCRARKDPVVDSIRNAALEAARATVFEPLVKNGEESPFAVLLTFPLTTQTIFEDTKYPFNARAKALPPPNYTSEAKAQRIGGTVEIHVLIDEKGSVLSLLPVSGHTSLIAGSLDSACKARFNPAVIAGQPTKVISKVTYRFVPP